MTYKVNVQLSSSLMNKCRGQLKVHLWLYVQYCYESLLMDLAYCLQLCAVHRVLVAAVLQVIVVGDVLHHLVVGYKEIILAVLFIFLWRSGCVFWGRNEFEVNSLSGWAIMGTVRDSDLGIFLTWNGISKSVWVFGDECVLDVSSANTVSTCQSTTNHTC